MEDPSKTKPRVPGFSHYHVNIIGASFPVPPIIALDEKSADQSILKLTEMAFVQHGLTPTKVVDGIVHLSDGSYIRKRGCTSDCHFDAIG